MPVIEHACHGHKVWCESAFSSKREMRDGEGEKRVLAKTLTPKTHYHQYLAATEFITITGTCNFEWVGQNANGAWIT